MALLKLKLKKLDPELEALFHVRPPVRVKIVLIKERHLKRLHELSLKSAEQKPQLEEPTEEQSQWVERRMKGSARTWKRWNEGIYFTEEQKQERGIK